MGLPMVLAMLLVLLTPLPRQTAADDLVSAGRPQSRREAWRPLTIEEF